MNWNQFVEEEEIYKYSQEKRKNKVNEEEGEGWWTVDDADSDELETVVMPVKLDVEFSSVHELLFVEVFAASIIVLCLN